MKPPDINAVNSFKCWYLTSVNNKPYQLFKAHFLFQKNKVKSTVRSPPTKFNLNSSAPQNLICTSLFLYPPPLLILAYTGTWRWTRLYVRRSVVSNSCRTQSGGATPLRLYETTYLVYDRTYEKTKSLHGMWDSLSENIRLSYTVPLYSISYIISYLLLEISSYCELISCSSEVVPFLHKAFKFDGSIVNWPAHATNH